MAKYAQKKKEKRLEVSEPEMFYTTPKTNAGNIMPAFTLTGGGGNEKLNFIELVRKGIGKEFTEQLAAQTGLSLSEIAACIHIPDRTLRRYAPSHILDSPQTEKLLEISRLYHFGEEVFGDAELFREWMNQPLAALGGIIPKELLDTSAGIELLFTQLGRISHGVFS